VDEQGPIHQPAPTAPIGERQCVFCQEDIRQGAVVCPRCGSNLVPLQGLADRLASLEQRVAALARQGAAQQAAAPVVTAAAGAGAAPLPTVASRAVHDLHWPHMADNIFLGVAALLAAHWLATTLPTGNRAAFRLVALVVALPFGFRFEVNARTGTAGQVLAALAFGCLGTLAISLLDAVLREHGLPPVTARDLVASVATITLSHYAGSALAHAWQVRRGLHAEAGASPRASGMGPLPYLEPARIKTTAEAVKALFDAAVPLAAGAAAVWAALGHLFS
jgi:hypothetical protein